MELKDRLKAARRHAGLTQNALAEVAGIKQASISDIETGKSQGSAYMARLASACRVSAIWLEDGKGSMLPDESGPDENGSPSTREYALIPQYTAKGSNGNGYHNDHVELKGGLVFKRDWLKRLSLKEESLVVIYADGSSMEPTISDGDVLLIDVSDRQPRSGRVYAIMRPDHSISIKRLVQQISGDWLIRSDSSDKGSYPDELISPDSLQQIEIIGRSVWGGGGM